MKSLLVLFLLFFTFLCYSQNLISNGSFEECKLAGCSCPKTFNDLAGNWITLNACGLTNSNIKNLKHSCFSELNNDDNKPYDGNGYMFYILSSSLDEVYIRNLFQVKLNSRLIKGKTYSYEFHLRFNMKPGLCKSGTIQLFFTKNNLYDSLFKEKKTQGFITNKIKLKPFYSLPSDKSAGYYKQWQKISGTYTANGTESYLIIGHSIFIDQSFCVDIDDIRLEPYEKESLLDTTAIKPGEALTLGNIFFESDMAKLLDASFTELNILTEYLQKNKTIKIEICGHTDNTGIEENNRTLSEERAKSVMTYLISKGISKGRLTYKGYGSTEPVADNSTEEGRKKNRRVEIMILEK